MPHTVDSHNNQVMFKREVNATAGPSLEAVRKLGRQSRPHILVLSKMFTFF